MNVRPPGRFRPGGTCRSCQNVKGFNQLDRDRWQEVRKLRRPIAADDWLFGSNTRTVDGQARRAMLLPRRLRPMPDAPPGTRAAYPVIFIAAPRAPSAAHGRSRSCEFR